MYAVYVSPRTGAVAKSVVDLGEGAILLHQLESRGFKVCGILDKPNNKLYIPQKLQKSEDWVVATVKDAMIMEDDCALELEITYYGI